MKSKQTIIKIAISYPCNVKVKAAMSVMIKNNLFAPLSLWNSPSQEAAA